MPACDERFGSNELAERLSESAERVLPDRFIRSEFRAIVLQASQGVGMLAGQDSEAAHLNSLKSALES